MAIVSSVAPLHHHHHHHGNTKHGFPIPLNTLLALSPTLPLLQPRKPLDVHHLPHLPPTRPLIIIVPPFRSLNSFNHPLTRRPDYLLFQAHLKALNAAEDTTLSVDSATSRPICRKSQPCGPVCPSTQENEISTSYAHILQKPPSSAPNQIIFPLASKILRFYEKWCLLLRQRPS